MRNPASDHFVRDHLEMRHLRLLVELDRHACLAHAARAARLTPWMASRLLGDLEQALGGRLFERTARGLVPTSAGEVLIRRAGAALAQMDAALREIAGLAPAPVRDSHAQGGRPVTRR